VKAIDTITDLHLVGDDDFHRPSVLGGACLPSLSLPHSVSALRSEKCSTFATIISWLCNYRQPFPAVWEVWWPTSMVSGSSSTAPASPQPLPARPGQTAGSTHTPIPGRSWSENAWS